MAGFLFAVVIFIFVYGSSHHPSDRTLIKNLQSHRETFEKLVRMANEDSDVEWLYDDSVVFTDYRIWPKDGRNRFSWERWNEYDLAFKTLGLTAQHEFDKELATVLIPASIETTEPDADYEYRVSVKGFAYSRLSLPTVDSLDSLGVSHLGRTYRRIDEHWYLYHDCGIGKPE